MPGATTSAIASITALPVSYTQAEIYTAAFRTSLTQPVTSARTAIISVAATQAVYGTGTFSIAIYDAGTDASPTNFEALQVIGGGGSLSWTVVTESGWTASAHAAGSTVLVTVLTPRSIVAPLNNHTNVTFTPNPHSQYVLNTMFQRSGDLLVGTGNGTYIALHAANPGNILIVDTTQTPSIRWSTQSITVPPLPANCSMRASVSMQAVPVAQVFGPSGANHAPGDVPDPGSTAGATRFLREDGTWVVPSTAPITGTVIANNMRLVATATMTAIPRDQVFGASGFTHHTGDVPDPGSSAGSTRFLREDATWALPTGGSAGGVRITMSGTQALLSATTTVAQWDTNDTDTNNQHPLTPTPGALSGTIAETATNSTLVGTSTSFTTQVAVGQLIQLGTTLNQYVITAVTDNTHIQVSPAGISTQSGQTGTTLNTAIVFPTAGMYVVDLGASMGNVHSALVTVQIRINNTSIIAQQDASGIAQIASYAVSTIKYFNQWDYVEALVTQHDSGTVALGQGGIDLTHFGAR